MRDQYRWTEKEPSGLMHALAETVSLPDGTFSVIIRDYSYRHSVSITINDNDGWCTDSMHADDLYSLKRKIEFFEEEVKANNHSHIYSV